MNEALYANENDSKRLREKNKWRIYPSTATDFPEHKTISVFMTGQYLSKLNCSKNKQTKWLCSAKQRVACKHVGMFKEGPLKHQIPLQNISDPPLLHLPPSLLPSDYQWERARSPRPLTIPLNIST